MKDPANTQSFDHVEAMNERNSATFIIWCKYGEFLPSNKDPIIDLLKWVYEEVYGEAYEEENE